MSEDLQTLARSISVTIKAHVDRRLDEFRASFRVPADGKDGAPGAPGERGAVGERGADGAPGERGSAGEPGERGADGAPGERGEPGAMGQQGQRGPAGELGERGADGLRGERGADGALGPMGERGLAGINGKDGAPGPAGRDFDPVLMESAVRSEVGKQFSDVYERVLRAMPAPKDGASVTIADVAPLLEGEVSKWELEFERRAAEMLQRALDRIPKGRDGKDGLGVEDFDLEAIEGGRVIAVSLRSAAGNVICRQVRTALTIDRGQYALAKSYEPGDGVTYGGSFWIAQVATDDSPGNSRGGMPWRLAVKHGRDAK
jgi:integrin beta 3